jgi:hypothetical protein
MGPTYRADLWDAMEAAPHLSTAELPIEAGEGDAATKTPRRLDKGARH